MTDIKERLRLVAQSPRSDNQLAKDALQEIERLEARLEIHPGMKYDGIDCRDETIRQLEINAAIAQQGGKE